MANTSFVASAMMITAAAVGTAGVLAMRYRLMQLQKRISFLQAQLQEQIHQNDNDDGKDDGYNGFVWGEDEV